MSSFDLLGPLPEGRLAIEASAGTGKTHTLSTLAARYVVEGGYSVGEVLVVTFTRAAAAELRERVRTRLVEVGSEDGIRLARAQAALADFDAASITTIHGFAQQALAALGTAAPGDPDASLADDGGELLRQVCTDVLVAESLRDDHPAEALLPLDTLVERVREVVSNPGLYRVPPPEPDASNEAAALRRRLVDRVTAELDRRRRSTGTLSFDDLLNRLRDALVDPVSGPGARATLRRRFRVGLIDEFQDTDPVQWEILRQLFVDDEADGTIVLVGDPKQAIYGFRGANVHTYLEAVASLGTDGAVLSTNWRSDAALLRGTAALLTGATFGDDEIHFKPVEPVDHHRDERITRRHGADGSGRADIPAVSLRLAIGEGLTKSSEGAPFSTPEVERTIFADLARTLHDLLANARLPTDAGSDRAVEPDDIAVLVGGHADSPKVRDALKRLGIPAVITRGEHVLNSAAATQWRWLLEAVSQPSDPLRARAACISWFVGWSANELAVADEAALATVQDRLHRWAETLTTHGVADFRRQVWTDSGVAARMLATADGDRAMTDLEHLAELLASNVPRRTGPVGLLAELDQMAADAKTLDVEIDAAARRIESEAASVQIMTVHTAKGLEFPIVCVPTLWRSSYAEARATIYEDAIDDTRKVDVARGVDWPTKKETTERKRLASLDAVGQNLRLLYVALTRAQHHTIVWWTRARSSNKTGLARVLFARDGAAIDPVAFGGEKFDLPPDAEADAFLAPMVAASGGTLAVEVIGATTAGNGSPGSGEVETEAALEAATLDRTLDRSRRRWSFTAITARAHDGTFDPRDASLGDAGVGDEGVDDLGDAGESAADLPRRGGRSGRQLDARGTSIGGTAAPRWPRRRDRVRDPGAPRPRAPRLRPPASRCRAGRCGRRRGALGGSRGRRGRPHSRARGRAPFAARVAVRRSAAP